MSPISPPPPPTGIDNSADEWWALAEVIEATTKALAETHEPLSEQSRDRLWSEATLTSAARAQIYFEISPELLPTHAQAHAQAANALGLVCDGGMRARGLTELTKDLLSPDDDLDPWSCARFEDNKPGTAATNRWDASPAEEAQFGSTAYLGRMQRAQATDPEADAAICILEALAQAERYPLAVWSEALGHPTAVVRWTAARLLPREQGYDQLRAAAASDKHPLVRARGTRRTHK